MTIKEKLMQQNVNDKDIPGNKNGKYKFIPVATRENMVETAEKLATDDEFKNFIVIPLFTKLAIR